MIWAMILASAAMAPDANSCRKVHYHSDGTVAESWVSRSEAQQTREDSASVRSKAAGSGSVSASSSVSVSSRSGKAVSRSSAEAAHDHGSIRMTDDGNNCTIIVDDRTPEGDDR